MEKQDFGWIKVDGQVTQSFSLGLILAEWSAVLTLSWNKHVLVRLSGCRNGSKSGRRRASFS